MKSPSTPFVSLMYHNVCESPARGGIWPGFGRLSPSVTNYFVDRETFSRHCELISRSGRALEVDEFRAMFRSESRDDACKAVSGNEPRVLLTFDDGWRGTIEVGAPILEASGLQALLFVTTDLIGHPQFVGLSQLRSLTDSFVVGSHAQTHRLLAQLSDEEVRAELHSSKAMLQDILGCEVETIAFPGGSFDRRVLRMTREAGYRFVFTSQPLVNRQTAAAHPIGRLAIKSGTSIETLERWLSGDVRRERLRSMGLDGVKRVLGRAAYRRLRSRLISEDVTQLEMTDLAGACDRAGAPSAVPT